jgi:dCMP deaminase
VHYAEGKEKEDAIYWLDMAANVALKSSCLRSRCGSVIVRGRDLLGTGWNSPPGDCQPEKCRKDMLPVDFKSDKTCCLHAEQRAIIDALRQGHDLKNSRLYFIRIDDEGNSQYAGQPYCTICSKMSLDSGIKEFVLSHQEGITIYESNEYNELSFQFGARLG